MRALAIAAAAVLAAGSGSAAAAHGSTTRPTILSLTASPTHIGASGGWVTVSVRVAHAVRCTFLSERIQFSSLYPATTVACSSGSARMQIRAVSNGFRRTVLLPFAVRATGADGSTIEKTVTVLQAGAFLTPAPKPTPSPPIQQQPPVVNLDVCTPGPDCYYGPAFNSYPNYGNVAPADLGDCTFAAAAVWEQIVLGLHPDPTVIGYEFAQAGGTAADGITRDAFFGYWQQQGIAGVRLTGLHSFLTDQTNVENGVRDYAAMVVEFSFAAGTGFGQYTVDAGEHMAVVDGFTPEGPLVVSWGQTLQLTWAQWSAEVVDMWGIGTA